MPKYVFTNKAVQDLTDIWYYTLEEWSEHQADLYYQQLIDTCVTIANNPDLGKSYNDIHIGLKGMISQKHIIFYRELTTKTIEITRILHGRMDLKRRFKE